MTNIYGNPKKAGQRRGLFALALDALAKAGWTVTRARGGGGASVRDIRKGADMHRVSIRTSQDSWIAFPRTRDDKGWGTLDDVDFVVAASVNRKHDPDKARVHLIPAKLVRERFDRAYKARKAAGYSVPVGRGVWVSLYEDDATEPVTHVGAGVGRIPEQTKLVEIPLAELPVPNTQDLLDEENEEDAQTEVGGRSPPPPSATTAAPSDGAPLTIAEAKRRLAVTFRVPETAIKITIEH